jgi:transposase
MATRKKTLNSSERDEEQRTAFRRRAEAEDSSLFVWVDECGTHTSMTRLYARAPKGERAYGKVARNRGKNTTLIASMTLEGAMGEAMAFEGSTKAFVFEAYVEHFLAPTLKRGQIVVMNNLSAHKTDKVRELIEGRGCQVWFLPSYSPDYNPIEEAFSKIKAHLKKVAARTREALLEAMGEALSAVTVQDARGWFTHCGYETEDQSS